MIASEPASSVARKALKISCLAPVPTIVSVGEYSRPYVSKSAETACRSSGMPATGGYLVCPSALLAQHLLAQNLVSHTRALRAKIDNV